MVQEGPRECRLAAGVRRDQWGEAVAEAADEDDSYPSSDRHQRGKREQRDPSSAEADDCRKRMHPECSVVAVVAGDDAEDGRRCKARPTAAAGADVRHHSSALRELQG